MNAYMHAYIHMYVCKAPWAIYNLQIHACVYQVCMCVTCMHMCVFLPLQVAMIVITQTQKALLQHVKVLYQPLEKNTPRAMAVF